MAQGDETVSKIEEPVTVSDHMDKIRSQVLAIIGRPPRLHRVEVSQHYNGNYRVNIWEESDPTENLAVSLGVHIQSSYYLKVSDRGEIIHSNPPLIKVGSCT